MAGVFIRMGHGQGPNPCCHPDVSTLKPHKMSNGEDLIDLPEIPQEIVDKLEQKSAEKKYKWMRFACKETLTYLDDIRELLKDQPGFWLRTFMSHVNIRGLVSAKADQEALSYLTDVELKQDPADPRPFELIFHFKENPYFSNSTLSKKYSLKKGVAAAPADGSVTEEMRNFVIDDLEVSAAKIDWKSDEKNLCKLQPRKRMPNPDDEDDDAEIEGDVGSFFWYFEESTDDLGVGITIQDDILPDAVDYFTGKAENAIENEFDEEFDDDELDEEDEDDDASVDLEDEEDEPKKKKPRT